MDRSEVEVGIAAAVGEPLDVVDVQRPWMRPTKQRIDGLATDLAAPAVSLRYALARGLHRVATSPRPELVRLAAAFARWLATDDAGTQDHGRQSLTGLA
jgi:hypothetical protein